MDNLEIKLEREGNKLILVLPRKCKDITTHWRVAYDIGTALGETAFRMFPHPSDPGQDEAEAAFVKAEAFEKELVVIHFRERTDRFAMTRNIAHLVAVAICDAAIIQAEKFTVKP